jgi:hypothetical protein
VGRVTSIAIVLGVLGACGGQSQAPPGTSDLACLTTIESNCCTGGAAGEACVGSFAAAEECAIWPTEAEVAVFSSPCAGMTAVRTLVKPNTYSSFYIYDAAGALYAIADDATAESAGSGPIECGAGPTGFVVPTACASAWLAADGGQCSAGTTSGASVCH